MLTSNVISEELSDEGFWSIPGACHRQSARRWLDEADTSDLYESSPTSFQVGEHEHFALQVKGRVIAHGEQLQHRCRQT